VRMQARLDSHRLHGWPFRPKHHDRAIDGARPASICEIPFDVHLMIALRSLSCGFAEAGRIRFRCCRGRAHLHRSLQAIRALCKKLAPFSIRRRPVSSVQNVLDLVDLVLVMSVNPGFGGQAFIGHGLEKVAELKAMTLP